ncbi:MAG: zincin-like metallopeptidase domain-containing protein, partial [Acetobacteraceae bacterium]|nr:zincin-like metallopeptidase domain-containing protein [Acetobacteraceae bacterium]
MSEWERHQKAEAILANSGVPIRHVPGDRAFYRLTEDTITLPERGQFPSGDGYYATALHELGHATGHPSRLARDMAHPFGSEGYAREELRAEIASLMLGEQLGIGHDPGQHVAYVGSWIKALQQDPREIFRAAADAEKITKLVRSFELERAQQTDQEQGDARELEPAGPEDRAGQGAGADAQVRPPV